MDNNNAQVKSFARYRLYMTDKPKTKYNVTEKSMYKYAESERSKTSVNRSLIHTDTRTLDYHYSYCIITITLCMIFFCRPRRSRYLYFKLIYAEFGSKADGFCSFVIMHGLKAVQKDSCSETIYILEGPDWVDVLSVGVTFDFALYCLSWMDASIILSRKGRIEKLKFIVSDS